MSVHDEMAENFAYLKSRPLVVRVIHIATGQVTSEHPIPPEMTGPEIQNWAQYLERVIGDEYELEIPTWGNAA